jgi:pimeloyl-ACP methyl ester carboxylesterase
MTDRPSPSEGLPSPARPARRLPTNARLLRTMVVLELFWAAGCAVWFAWLFDWGPAPAMLAGLAVPLGTHATVIAINFGIAAAAGSPTPPGHRLGLVGALRVYLREVVDSIRVFQWAQPWLARRPLPGESIGPQPAGAPLPVVLVHGYLCNRQLWRPFAGWLAKRGHAVQGVDLEPIFGSIDTYVPLLAQAVETLRERTGAERVALVCHSMGGLAARAYLRAHPDAPVAAVVTIGTPHRGTFHARLGQGANAVQMRPDSGWLQALAQSEGPALRARFTIIFSHHDNIVAPQANQTLPDAKVLAFSGMGHLTLALDARVWLATGQSIAAGQQA